MNPSRFKRAARLSKLFLVLLLCSVELFAESARTVSGKITGPSGSSVPQVQLSVRNMKSDETRSLVAGEDGSFSISGLLPGSYELTASAQGFGEAQATVTVGSENPPDVTLVLEPGSDAPQASPQSMTSGVVGDLPLNGRSASDVAALEPGVLKASTQGTAGGPGQSGYGQQMTIFGGRPRQNSSLLSGINVNDYANGTRGNAANMNLGVDALDQMRVLTSNDQAEFGRSSGGVISSDIRSGSNAFHGSIFEYIRDQKFDAKNYFNNGKPRFRRHQFGASAGGAIWKDRTFVFGNYEGVRQVQGVAQVGSVPSEAARMGQLSVGPVVVDPEASRFLDAFFPLPNRGLQADGDTGVYVSQGARIAPADQLTTRVDHKISDRDSLYGALLYTVASERRPDHLGNKLIENNSRQKFLTLSYSHTFSPALVNQFRFGINRLRSLTGRTSLLADRPLAGDPSFAAIPGTFAPFVEISGVQNFAGGLGGIPTGDFDWTSIQAYNDLSLTRGKHDLKFGVGVERMLDNVLSVPDPNGHFVFNSLSHFLANEPDVFRAPLSTSIPERGLRQTLFNAYVQDGWRIRPNFLLNLGVRYEMTTSLSEVHGYLTKLQNLTDAQPTIGQPLIQNPTLHNFEPRIGFAWDPLGDSKTLVSSGFGIFDVLPLPYVFQFGQSYSDPFLPTGNLAKTAGNLPAGSFPFDAYPIAQSTGSTASRQAYYEPKPGRNYVMQWNLTIQRRLPQEIQMKIGYVGSRGVHQIFRVNDADIVPPTLTPQGYLWPAAGTVQRLNPAVGRIDAVLWNGGSSYNAFVLQVRKTLSRGQIAGSYTWGRSIDTSSGSIAGDEYMNALSSPLWFDPSLNRGVSDYNVKHNARVIYSWQMTGPKVGPALVTWALGGWQIGGVFQASSGSPFTAGVAGDLLGLQSTDPSVALPNLVPSPGCKSPINPRNPDNYIKAECFTLPNPTTLLGNAGRNNLVGPGLMTLDASLFKNNYIRRISDVFNLQFRAEIFNLQNRANFDAPLRNRFVLDSQGQTLSSAGLIDTTQTPNRQVQFALRMIW